MKAKSNTPKRVAMYIRVSDPKQVAHGYSLEIQEKAIRSAVESREWYIVSEYRDEGISAKDIKNRPAFNRMLADASKNLWDCVYVHDFSRMNRNFEDAGKGKYYLRNIGIEIFSVIDQSADDDPNNPSLRLSENIKDAVYDHFRVTHGINVRKGREGIWDAGLYWGNGTPYGFMRGEPSHLIPNPETSPFLIQLYERYASGDYSLDACAKWLTENGQTSTRGMRFSASSVQVILLNPIYKGLISSNASGEYQEKRGVHEPLVSDELWAKVQAVKASREYGMKKATIDHKPHLLGGLVYCTECMQGEPPTDIAIERWGKMFMNRGRKPRKDGSLYKLSYYQCDAHHQAIHMEKLEDQIVAFLTDENLSHLWANEAQKIVAVGIETEDIEARIKEIEGIMSRMNEAYFKGFITDVQKWEQDQSLLKLELDSLRPTHDDAYEKSIDLVHNFAKHWQSAEGDIEAQRRLIRLVLKAVYVENGQLVGVAMMPDNRIVFETDDLNSSASQNIQSRLRSLRLKQLGKTA